MIKHSQREMMTCHTGLKYCSMKKNISFGSNSEILVKSLKRCAMLMEQLELTTPEFDLIYHKLL